MPQPAPAAGPAPPAGGSSARFRTLLADREFRALWISIAQSHFGDQLGRVALSILVFSTTGSGALTAGVYALTFVPTVVGGVLLSDLADRFPRRTLLVVCDLLRAALFALMAIPGVPLGVVATLLTIAVVIGAPHKAAEPAVVADMYDGDRYTAALGLRTATTQIAQLLGFALGGVIVAAVGARMALAADAATFFVSAALLRAFLTDRPAARADATRFGISGVRQGLGVVFQDRRLRTLACFAWLAGCWVVPEGLAAPYAASHGGGSVAVGLLLTSDAIGVLVGSLILSRIISVARRPGVIGPLAIASGLPLLACWGTPPIPVAFGLWTICALVSSYQVLVIAEFVAWAPAARRGQAIGIAASGLVAVQGVGIALGGVLAGWVGTGPAVALAGAVGSALAVPTTLAWQRARGEAAQLPSRLGDTARRRCNGPSM